MLSVSGVEIKFEIANEGRIQFETPGFDDAVFSRDLAKSIQGLADRKGRLEECMSALKIESVPKALLWKRIRNLEK